MRQRPIGVDGFVGNETIGAIADFQKKAFGWSDGRIDRNGQSLRRLNEIFFRAPLVNPKTYRWGSRFQVTIGEDGRLFVQPGDWLTKYSAAINNDFFHVYDFARQSSRGGWEWIRNYNRIRAGETLLHLPTWRAFNKLDGYPIKQPPPPPLTDAEKKKIAKETLKNDYNLPGDSGAVVATICDAIGMSSQVADGLSIFLPALEGLATVAGLIAVPLGIASSIIGWANASDTDVRIYGMRAVAYSQTAWAFGDPALTSSPTIRRNYYPATPEQLARYDRFWKTCWDAAQQALEQTARAKGGKPIWQAALRGLGQNNRQNLCLEVMKQLLPKLDSGTPREVWVKGYEVLYPA